MSAPMIFYPRPGGSGHDIEGGISRAMPGLNNALTLHRGLEHTSTRNNVRAYDVDSSAYASAQGELGVQSFPGTLSL